MTDCVANKGECCSGSYRSGTYGNAYDVAQITIDKCGRISRIKNVAIDGLTQWTGIKGYPIYYVPYVGIGSNVIPTSNLQVTGNVYVSNTVTSGNVHVFDTLDVTGSMTANAANATFFFDTFTIPYINTQYLNVVSTTTLTTANIASLNVGLIASPTIAPTIASATTIAPTAPITFISGTSNIVTITPPVPILATGGSLTFIPTGAFVSNTAGNIALGTTAVVSMALVMTWDASTAKWYPSYF